MADGEGPILALQGWENGAVDGAGAVELEKDFGVSCVGDEVVPCVEVGAVGIHRDEGDWIELCAICHCLHSSFRLLRCNRKVGILPL